MSRLMHPTQETAFTIGIKADLSFSNNARSRGGTDKMIAMEKISSFSHIWAYRNLPDYRMHTQVVQHKALCTRNHHRKHSRNLLVHRSDRTLLNSRLQLVQLNQRTHHLPV